MHHTLNQLSSDPISHPRSGGVLSKMMLGIGLLTTAAVAATLGGSRESVDSQPVAAATAKDDVPHPAKEDMNVSAPVLEVRPVSMTTPLAETVEPTLPALADLPDGVIPAGSVVTVMVGDVPVSMTIADKGAVTVLGDRRFVHEVSLPFGWSKITLLKVEKKGQQIMTTGTAGGLQSTSTRTIDEVTVMCTKALEKGQFEYKVPSFVATYDGRLREEKADLK